MYCNYYDTHCELANFRQFSIFTQDLEIAEPDPVVSNAKRDDVINKWLAAWMMVRCTECLKCQHYPLQYQ